MTDYQAPKSTRNYHILLSSVTALSGDPELVRDPLWRLNALAHLRYFGWKIGAPSTGNTKTQLNSPRGLNPYGAPHLKQTPYIKKA